MQQTLIQNRLLDKRDIKILDNKFTYYDKRFDTSGFEVTIAYEDLTNNKSLTTNNSGIILWSALGGYCISFCLFMMRNDKDVDPFMWLYILIIATAALVFYFLKKENSFRIRLANNSGFIQIHRNIPNTITVDAFIENLYAARDQYLRETYLTLDKNLSYELQYKNLKWLRHVEAISKQEFETKYDELKTLFQTDKRTIGFGA